jgi:ribulose 1,5-bisphosphate synthetase/thiazole synthase
MIENWIKRYFSREKIPEVLDVLSEYGTESWHREEDRVKRDIVIISAGSMEKLKATVMLAKNDYRDVLIGEAIDPLVIEELKKYKT